MSTYAQGNVQPLYVELESWPVFGWMGKYNTNRND